MPSPAKPPLLTRTQALTGIVLSLLGAGVASMSWAYGRGTTETEQRSAVVRNADAIEVNATAIRQHAEALTPLASVPARLDALEREQARQAVDLSWLVRHQGGVPARAEE